MQDGSTPIHHAPEVHAWFSANNIGLITWPENSPDLNPLEDGWDLIKAEVYKSKSMKTQEALWQRFQRVYEKVLTPDVCLGLIDSMPRRIQAVLSAGGDVPK
ncbi:hypothetical protein CAOG_08947 [Capsaspora owczarzaki ATCC 30864]|uniref:hypothetical protein n=1 Tax=Capsaspora owczarzaki (strain ATCC 30864) TaxID=595528 RepID=UPI0003524514|nr:hypothetical protein CAOG_08947 [Capsaspora owczarzaki ATCC 30864]|eukprot:XP_011270618.1 hypothetical protein CAOG_08947 [Capsaspora owczarzaki ATCC 30864]